MPFAVKLVDEREAQFSPDGTLSVSATGPTSPCSRVTVIVDFADEPTFTGDGEVAVMMKSGGMVKVKETVTEWESEPLVPLTVTLYTLAEDEPQDRVAVPDPVRLLGEIVPQTSPLGTVSERLTVPENPFDALRVTVEVEEPPTLATGGDEAEMTKSGEDAVTTVTGWELVAVCWGLAESFTLNVTVYVPADA